MTNLCGDFGSLSPIWSTLKGLPSSILLHGFGWGLVGALSQLNFSLCPLSTRWSTCYMLISISESDSQKTQFMAQFFFFFLQNLYKYKTKKLIKLEEYFYFIHENLGKLLFLLYNFSIASWKTRNYWTCVSYVFFTLWSKTVRKKVQPNLWLILI